MTANQDKEIKEAAISSTSPKVKSAEISLESNYGLYLINEETNEILACFTKLDIKDEAITLTKGLIDRFQLIKYLRPRSIKEVTQPNVNKLPKVRLVLDAKPYLTKTNLLKPIYPSTLSADSRLELEGLTIASIDISILPGDKMAVNTLSIKSSGKFTAISTPLALSNYKNRAWWNTLTFNEVAPAPFDETSELI